MLLEFEHVTGTNKKFALQDVSFTLPEGYIMGLAGKNGAGKSTLIDYIVNPVQQYTGTIRIGGVDIREDFCRMKNKIGLVTEQNPFFTERSVLQNAELMGRFYEEWDMALFKEQIKRMELPGYRTVGKLSRGEFFRFQMAFAMAHHPSLYLLVFVGAVTGVGGGLMRDIMAGDTPYIFVKHIYACASLAGALLCGLLWQTAGEMTSMLAGAGLVFAIRCLSAHYRWNLPKTHD